MGDTDAALAKADAADAQAARVEHRAPRLLVVVFLGVIAGLVGLGVIAGVLIHLSATVDTQGDTLKSQAAELANDRHAAQQRDEVVSQVHDLTARQDRFERLLADLLGATSKDQADQIRQQIAGQFGSNASPPTSSTTTTTTTAPATPSGQAAPRPSSSTTSSTTRPPSSTTSTSHPAPSPIPLPLPPLPPLPPITLPSRSTP